MTLFYDLSSHVFFFPAGGKVQGGILFCRRIFTIKDNIRLEIFELTQNRTVPVWQRCFNLRRRRSWNQNNNSFTRTDTQ